MKKIIIEDVDLNERIYFKEDVDVDVFIEQGMAACQWGLIEDLTITVLDMSKDQIDALRYLHETDWYVVRSVDPGSGIEVPAEIIGSRQYAREVL